MKENENISRRAFFKRLGGGSLAVAAVATSCSAAKKAAGATNVEGPQGDITYRTSPKGDKISILGYGCMRWPQQKDENGKDVIIQEEVNRLVDYAIAHGVNYFDTAPKYLKGKSEEATAIALQRHKRSEYFLATKLTNTQAPYLKQDAIDMYEQSFRRLKVDYIDYYLLHTIAGMRKGVPGPETFKKRFLDNGVLDWVLEKRKKGEIRNLGFSFHGDKETFDYLMGLHEKYHWDFVQIQMNYVDWNHAEGFGGRNTNASYLYEELTKRGIPVIIMEPLRGGALAKLNDHASAQLLEKTPDASIASWAFRFAGTFPNVLTVLSGMTYMENLQDNLKTYSPLKPLTDEEIKMLDGIADDYVRFPLVPCTGCEYCMPCPAKLEIPAIFAHYNKCVNEGNVKNDTQDPRYKQAREAFLLGYDKSVPRLAQADKCVSCGKCTKACPQNIDIPRWMKRISKYTEKLRSEGL